MLMKRSPIFVFGNRRSGTTLLRVILNSHPEIAIPAETNWPVECLWLTRLLGFASRIGSRKLVRRTSGAIVKSVRQLETRWRAPPGKLVEVAKTLLRDQTGWSVFVDETMRAYASACGRDIQRWGFKSTWFFDHFREMDQALPGAMVIHIVRDPRAVAASYRGVRHLPDDVATVASEWVTSVEQIERLGEHVGPSRYCRVRFSDLVSSPTETIESICRSLDMQCSPQMADYHRCDGDHFPFPVDEVPWKGRVLSAPDPSRIDHWREVLTERESRKVLELSSKTMTRLGVLSNQRGRSAVPAASTRLFGARLSRRVRAHVRPLVHSLRAALGRD